MANLREFVMLTKPRVLIYGASGCGKTHFIGTCPKPYVMDFDNGIETLGGKDIEYDLYEPLHPDTWLRFSKKLREFEEGRVPGVETLAIDSLTALCDCIEADILRLNRRDFLLKSDQDWGMEISTIEQVMYRLNTASKHYHVVVTAHEQLKEDAVRGETFVVPIVSGKKMPFALPKFFTEVYRIYTERTKEKLPEYKLLTCADRRYSAKTRLGGIEPIEVPNYGLLLGKYQRLRRGDGANDGAPTVPASQQGVPSV